MPKVLEPVLTPQDLPWGRQTNARLGDLERNGERSALEQIATNKGLAASLSNLSEQVRDLTGRVSYAIDSDDSNNWTTTQADNAAWGPGLEFTVSEPRIVSLNFTLSAGVRVSSVGTASGYTSLKPTLFLNGNQVGPSQPHLEVILMGAGSDLWAPLTARALISVPAGNHTLRGGFAWRRVTQSSGSGLLGIISAKDPSLMIDVLQTLGA